MRTMPPYDDLVGRKPKPQVVEYVRADGSKSYRVRIRAHGRQTTETFETRQGAEVFAIQVADPDIGPERAVEMRARSDQASAAYIPTVAEELRRHVADLSGVESRTKEDYLKIATRTWLPMLGHLPVDQVTRGDVAKFVNRFDGQIAPKTVKNAHSVLSSVMETALRGGHITHNPARGTRLPRTGEEDQIENRYLTHAEFDRLYTATPEAYRPFVVTLFGTGLRFSEATGLQVHDVDLDAGTLRVVRAWKAQKGGPKVGPPKSKASRRTIALPNEVVEVLGPLVRGRAGHEWLFTATKGGPVRHANFYNRIWIPACAAAELSPRPRIHDSRHTHASWLISQGIRLEVIQDRLGHDDYQTTRRIYGHLMPDMIRQGALAAEAAFALTSIRSLKALPSGQSASQMIPFPTPQVLESDVDHVETDAEL